MAISFLPERWKEDIIRGVRMLRSGTLWMAHRSIAEAERIRLTLQCHQIHQQLIQSYESLGKRVMEHWEGVLPLSPDEKGSVFQEIGLLLREQKKLMEQIRDIENFPQERDQEKMSE